MVADFLERVDGLQNARMFSRCMIVDKFGRENVFVQSSLYVRQSYADDVDDFFRKMLRQQIVGPSQNEFVDKRLKLRRTSVAELLLLLRTSRLAAAFDRSLELSSKMLDFPENAWIGKVDHGVKLTARSDTRECDKKEARER